MINIVYNQRNKEKQKRKLRNLVYNQGSKGDVDPDIFFGSGSVIQIVIFLLENIQFNSIKY